MYANAKLNPTTFIGARTPVPVRLPEPDQTSRAPERISDREIPIPQGNEHAAHSMHAP